MSDEKDPKGDVPENAEAAPFDDDALRKLVKRAMTDAKDPDAASPDATAAEIATTPSESDEAPSSIDDPPLPPDAEEDVAIQSLLRKAVEKSPVVVPDLVSGVQRKLRKRSRGKFYRDRFSTTASRTSYAIVAVAMLLVLALAYLVLGPTGFSIR